MSKRKKRLARVRRESLAHDTLARLTPPEALFGVDLFDDLQKRLAAAVRLPIDVFLGRGPNVKP